MSTATDIFAIAQQQVKMGVDQLKLGASVYEHRGFSRAE